MRRNYATLLFVLMVISFALVSCKIEEKAPAKPEIYPDMMLTNATYTYGQPNRNPLSMKAQSITIWEQDKKTELTGVTFSQNDDSSEVELTGKCDSAITYNNDKVQMSGNIQLVKKTDNIVINCDSLEWDDKKQTVVTNGIVSVSYQDGTKITAEGFKAYLDKNIYEFTRIIDGSFTSE